jgi:exopolyphosphatase
VTQGSEPRTLAAVDLGSNSFHLIIARETESHLHVIDRMRESVRLAAGLTSDKYLTPEVQERSLECLARFGQRLKCILPRNVRAVGTNTLRLAHNADTFLDAARRALGHSIEVIGGIEEARLIYLGVAHSVSAQKGRTLVVDIGGGSTELIIGEAFDPLWMESLSMGCVNMSQEYFPEGLINQLRVQRAEVMARLELQPVEVEFQRLGWETVIGSSGTVLAIADVLQAAGWCEGGITRQGLVRLREALIDAAHVKRLTFEGLRHDRAPVFPSGVIILKAVFEALNIEYMTVSEGALREGLLYDLLGRMRHEDVRDATIQRMVSRYHVDRNQADRVALTALSCLAQVREDWALDGEEPAQRLAWAARLHELGLTVAHNQYHKHGAYLVKNADLPGFSREEQRLLAALVHGHRRKFPKAVFRALPMLERERALRLCVLLRLAVLLHRGRLSAALPPLVLKAEGDSLWLEFPDGWLNAHPLTRADLIREAEYLKAAKLRLILRVGDRDEASWVNH